MKTIQTLFVLVLIIEHNKKSVGKEQKLIFQKDLSEHCRRHVVPSIFLGRQVVEANARLLQFSRLELPYSCFISIRTESGSNMVMTIQLTPNELATACAKNTEQVLVYEMGETFGGYWGPLPDSVTKRDPLPTKVYTLKTSHPSTTQESSSTLKEETVVPEETMETSTMSEKTTGDYIEIEIPLLNVSVHLEPDNRGTKPVEKDESLDLHNDVTPIRGVKYDRRVLPPVQFHPLEQPAARRDGKDDPPKYELDIVQEFTPDIRLTMPHFNPTSKRRISYQKQRYQFTKHLNFEKHRTTFYSHRYHDGHTIQETRRRMNNASKYTFPTIKTTEDKTKHTQSSWQVINELLQKLNKTKVKDKVTTFTEDEVMLLESISNMNHNSSAYLSSNLFARGSPDVKYRNNGKHTTWEPASLPIETTKTFHQKENTVTEGMVAMTPPIVVEDSTKSENTELTTTSVLLQEILTEQMPLSLVFPSKLNNRTENDNLENTTKTTCSSSTFAVKTTELMESSKEGFIDVKNRRKIVTGSMVGHESWENLVQAAPEMAELLNQTIAIAYDETDSTREFNETLDQNKLLKPKKREVHSIDIESARPHNITTKRTSVTTTQASFEVADMQEFAQLVELQDDELHGRVALRYLRQYVGPALFNLCDLDETTIRHVHLFNSSRIVLAITNFTLERMLVILTAARTLLNGEMQCPGSQLECQVAGARVCLDSMVACDGVPNCGSYDIYDEDRLLCGSSLALQHNVYLAAFTFLAVLLTLLYAVHYWLKRCVPKVADAFFVYTNGVENILYLDTIMRSPNDTNAEESKMVYHSQLYGDENMYDEELIEPHKTACQRFLQTFCICFRKKQKKLENADTCLSQGPSKRMYSFTELEISKMLSTNNEAGVQTGDSLEMKFFQNLKKRSSYSKSEASYDISLMIQDSLLTLEEPLPEDHADELSLLKFFNDARTDSIASTSKKTISKNKPQENVIQLDEKEISSLMYDRTNLKQAGPSKRNKTDISQVTPSSSVGKHLRFDHVTRTIPSVEYDDDEEGSSNVDRRRSVALGESSWRGSRPLDTIEEAEEHLGSGKEHRHFWGTITGKKSKKRTVFYTK